MAEIYPHPKMNARQWVENFWYHYRWQFLFGLVAALFIGIALVQSFLQKDPDASFLYVGPVALNDDTCRGIISSAEERFTEDYNGNGRMEADIRTIQLSTKLDALSPHQKNEADKSYQRYVEEILTGDDFFLLVSPEFYEKLEQAGALMSQYEIFGFWRDEAVLTCGILLKETPLWQCEGFQDLPSDTVLCLKYASRVNGSVTEEEMYALNELNAKIFRDLCD